MLTWWPGNIVPIGHLVTAAFTLPPTVWGDQGASRRLCIGHKVVGAVGILHLRGLTTRGPQIGTYGIIHLHLHLVI